MTAVWLWVQCVAADFFGSDFVILRSQKNENSINIWLLLQEGTFDMTNSTMLYSACLCYRVGSF
jgi:hypothetical protein